MTWTSSSTRTMSARAAASAFSSVVTAASTVPCAAGEDRPGAAADARGGTLDGLDDVGPERDRDRRRPDRGRARRSARRSARLASSAMTVVLPKPAGADTSVNVAVAARSTCVAEARTRHQPPVRRPGGGTWSRAAVRPSARRPDGQALDEAPLEDEEDDERRHERDRQTPRTAAPRRSHRTSRTSSGPGGRERARPLDEDQGAREVVPGEHGDQQRRPRRCPGVRAGSRTTSAARSRPAPSSRPASMTSCGIRRK